MRSARRVVRWVGGRGSAAATLRLVAACLVLIAACEGVAGAVGVRAFAPLTRPVSELPPGSVKLPPGSTGTPDGAASLPSSATGPSGASVRVLARSSAGESVPGAMAPFFAIVSNSGERSTTRGRPVVLTIRVPRGLSFAGVTELDQLRGLTGFARGRGAPPQTSWHCSTAGSQVRCVLAQADGGGLVPEPLAARSTTQLLVLFRVAAAFQPGARGSVLATRFSIAAPGNTAAGDTSVAADVTIAHDLPRPQLFPDVGGSPSALPGRPATETIDLLNVGSGAARPSGGRPSIALANLLPPALVGTWRAAGAGWTCSGVDPACTYRGAVEVGALAPRLTLTYVINPARAAALKLPAGGASHVAQWNFRINSRGASPASPVSFPAQLAIAPPPGSSLMPEVIAAAGIDELLPGTSTSLDVRLSNLGKAATNGRIALHGTIPSGVRLVGALERGLGGTSAAWACAARPLSAGLDGFTCLSSAGAAIPAASSIELTLLIRAGPGARSVQGAVTLAARAANQIPGAEKTASVPLIVLPGDVGFPALTLSEATGSAASSLALRPAADGAPAALAAGGRFAERLDVRDAGGAAIPAGSEARLDQLLGPGVRVRAIRRPAGWTCDTTVRPAALHCTVRFTQLLSPAASITGPTVLLTPTTATRPATNWPARIRLTGSGAAPAARLPVLVTVSASGPSLLPDVTTLRVPTAGGTGRFRIDVSNSGNAATRSPVRLALRLPAGARLLAVSGLGWRCGAGAASATCTSSARLAPGARISGLNFQAAFARRTGRRTLTIFAAAADGSARATSSAVARATVTPRPALHASIRAPNTVVFVDAPLVNPNAPLIPSSVTLEGDGSGGSGLGLTYTWTQRCTTAADVHAGGCRGVTPRVGWLEQPAGTIRPSTANVAFTPPSVTRPTTLIFELTVSDGSATSSAVVRIHDIPPTPASAGFAFNHPHPGRPSASGPAFERRRLPAPAQRLHRARAAHGRRQAAHARASRLTARRSQARDSGSLPQAFCDLVRDAANGHSSFSQSFGPVSFALNNVKLSGSGCSADTTLSFSDSSLKLSSYLDARGVAGSVSKDGVTLTAGSFTGPESWHAPTFKLASKGLTLPFGSGASVEIAGSISGDGLAFVPLPSGWTATTTLDFAATSDSTSVALSASGTGPAVDAGPGSPRPTVTIDGAIASDGTFSLDVALTRLVQLQGHSLDVTGHVARTAAGGPLELKLAGKLNDGFDIVPGLHVQSLSVAMAPTDTSLGLTGEGTILVSTGSGSLGLGVKFAYDDPRNWSLTADGVGTTSWEPLPGLTIRPSDVHGSITAKDDRYEFSLRLAPAETWSPASGIEISKLQLSLSNTCPDTGAPCPKDAAAFLDLSGDASFKLPGVGTVSSTVRGTLALPSGEFSVAAALTKPVEVGGGISIDTGKVELSRGLSVPSGTALLADSAEPGGLRLTISGSATLPLIGKIPTVEAAFSSKGFSVAAQLGSFSLPGGGDGAKLGDTVVGWSSFPTSLSVSGSKLELPANTFEVSGSFDTPRWLTDTLKLPSDFHARATGSLNTANGNFALRVEIGLPKTTYVYGDASSATSVRIATAYVEIARKGGDFSIALGGTARLSVAATSSLPASDVDLGVALSFSASSQTVAGELTISSNNGWQQAFGVKDLTLFDLALSFQIDLKTGIPAIGFGARAVLPGAIRDPLGIPNGAQTTLVANISLTTPCLGVQVDDPAHPGTNVLDIARKGVLTAKQFEFEIAPSGCTVGQFHYDPGLSINFDGAIAGVNVAVAAHMGITPFALDAKVDIGEFAVGGVDVQKTHVEIAVSTRKLTINFAGGMTVLGTTVEVSGGLEQAGATTKIDFRGSLDKLALGNAVTLKAVLLDAHVELGVRPKVSFTAKGSIDLLGSTADAEFSLGIDNGALIKAHADVRASIAIGGSGGVVLDGMFRLDYEPNKALAIDASVTATAGGFRLGNATVHVRPSSIELTAELQVSGVFKASLAGALYYGEVPSGSQILGPGGKKVAPRAGDFLLSARDVSLNLGGFPVTGTVEFGRANGQIWGNVATRIQLLGTGRDNSVAIAGSFSSNGNFSFAGSGDVNLVGVTAKLNLLVARSGATVTVHGDTTVSVLGSNIAFAGDFQYDRGTPRVRLSGSGGLVLGGYRVADGRFFFSNFPSDAGMYGEVHITAGSVLDASGRLTIVGSRFYLGIDANLNLRTIRVPAQVTFTNCTDASCRVGASSTTLDARGAIYYGGFSFAMAVRISSDGSFRATMRSPVSGQFYGRTRDIYFAVVALYADFRYQMQLTISSSSPYVELRGAGDANLYGKSWGYRGWFWWGWSGWSHILGLRASIDTNPFKVCGYVSVWGVWFGGCSS